MVDLVRTVNWNLLNDQNILPETNMEKLKRFTKVQHELMVNDDASMMLRGSRIVLPAKLQTQAINIAHEDHQDIVKTKQFLREKIWFPGIDDEVKKMIVLLVKQMDQTSIRTRTGNRLNFLYQ